MAKKYKIQRKVLITQYSMHVHKMIDIDQVTNDLIKGSEFILTAQDILDSIGLVDGYLLKDSEGKSPFKKIPSEDIKIVYNKK